MNVDIKRYFSYFPYSFYAQPPILIPSASLTYFQRPALGHQWLVGRVVGGWYEETTRTLLLALGVRTGWLMAGHVARSVLVCPGSGYTGRSGYTISSGLRAGYSCRHILPPRLGGY